MGLTRTMTARTWSVAVALLLLPHAAAAKAGGGRDWCSEPPATIVVDLHNGHLFLCVDRHLVKQFTVATGSGGAGKRAANDNKTPVGSYAIGEPRVSKEFGTFIPIGYPTAEQRSRGATGGDVGIHGPKRGFSWLGRAGMWVNWTRGCIAVASDAQIREIADWIRRNRPAEIHLD